MAISKNQYTYNITASYINGKKETKIPNGSILACYITYDYELTNSPLFVMKVKLNSTLYNTMQDNKETGKIVVGIGRASSNSGTPVKYIYKQFSYHFPTKKFSNITQSMDGTTPERNDSNAYVQAVIGLVDDSIMNANRLAMVNNIFRNSNNISIIHYYTNAMRMIIEPFDYAEPMDLCVLPPMESISQLIKYMNTISSFYTTGYRFFMDYNYTYLLSNKGNSIDIKDGTFTTIEITVDKETEEKGLGADYKQKIYTLQVKEDQIDYSDDDLTEKKFNKLYGIDSKGNKTITELDIPRSYDSKDRYKLIRLPNDNTHYLENYKNTAENSGAPITVSIADMDNSLFVPYKQFIFSFFRERRACNGVYILSRKQEVYISQGDGTFYSTMLLKFKKKH